MIVANLRAAEFAQDGAACSLYCSRPTGAGSLRRASTAITPHAAELAIAQHLVPLPLEVRSLQQCVGRILRQDVYAERDNPPFDRVCMDGIAIDSHGGPRRSFLIEASQAAGAPPVTLSTSAHAIEVMTGAILPRGTDCVIPLEEYELQQGTVTLKAEAGITAFRNVQRRGSDSQPGVPMLRTGTRLGAPEIAVVASAGLAQVSVSAQPAMRVISTGDELIDPGQPIADYQVRRSNAYAIVAALRDRGFTEIADDHIPDNENALLNRLARHLGEASVLILSGGVSKGRFDLVPQALKELKVREVFHQVAQRPGMPMWFGVGSRQQTVFGLPGNPVSTLMCLIRYVVPALRTMMGETLNDPERVALAESFALARKATSFVPVLLRHDERGASTAVPKSASGSGDFLSLAGTSGFIELPPRPEPFPAGFAARFYRW
ncbi:MAG TPA: molybdopterin molybdotransferase MoeA [Steroidobacteraceae bacterium]|nr:molybdopterin molybdotransferase MoeA [Steroidobacteraceae bacterium]